MARLLLEGAAGTGMKARSTCRGFPPSADRGVLGGRHTQARVWKWAACLGLLAGGVPIAVADDRTAAKQAAIEEMLAEPLAVTSPDGLRMANRLLTRTLRSGLASRDSGDAEHRKQTLDSYVLLLKALLQHTLDQAEHHPNEAKAYKFAAVPMAYNLAANTWLGWGLEEVGPVGQQHRRLGLAAARKNIELAADIGLGPERRRNGYWVLGAQLLAAADYQAATAAFERAVSLARESADVVAALMAEGWIHVAGILGDGEPDHARKLERVKEELRRQGGDGPFYADQYDPAIAALRSNRQAP